MSELVLNVKARSTRCCESQDRQHKCDGAGGYGEDHNAVVGKKHGVHRKLPLLCPAKSVRQERWCAEVALETTQTGSFDAQRENGLCVPPDIDKNKLY